MELDARTPDGGGEGCLVGFVRLPVKVVAVIVVLPVRVVWDLLVAVGRGVRRRVLGPLYAHVLEPVLGGLGWVLGVLLKLVFVWPWVGLWRYVLAPVGRAVAWVAVPVGRALYRYLLHPLGVAAAWVGRGGMRYLLAPLAKGIGWTAWALGMVLFVWPWVGLWRYALRPAGQGLLSLGAAGYRYVLVPVATAVWRYLLRPAGLAVAWLASGLYRYVLAPVGQVLGWAWRVAGRIVRALGRGLRWAGWVFIGWPASQVYRHVLRPAGHAVREVWRTARAAVREARAEVRRVLFGAPPREPARSRARTLGSTTAVGDTPAREISQRAPQG